MAEPGSASSMAGSFVALENSALAEVSSPGAMMPPTKQPSLSMTSRLVAVPKSTTITGAP